MSALKDALSNAFASFGEPELDEIFTEHNEVLVRPVEQKEPTILEGNGLSLTISDELAQDGFFITGIISAIADRLQYTKVWAIDTIEDIETQAAEPNYHGEPRGMKEKQQMFYNLQFVQLERLVAPLTDVTNWWAQTCDNPSLKLFRRSDAQVRQDIKRNKALKEEQRLANIRHLQGASDSHDRQTYADRKADVLKKLKAA